MPTTTPFNNLITFSRGSNATLTGSNGLIQWAPNNLLLQSESFDAAAWTKSNATTVINTTVAPDGTTTADKIVENTANAWHGVKQSAGTGVVGTFSFYAKAAERSRVWAAGDDPDFAVAVAVFNLSNGTVQSGAGTITDVGNGWYRCSINATISARGCTVALANDAGTVIRVGDGTSGVFLWGAQLELGSTATTYNPTTVKNLLGFSEAFDNAAWTKGGASIVTGAQANPVNGLFNAQKLMEDTSTGDHRTFQAANVTNGTPYVFSAYVKPAGRTIVNLTSVSGALMNVTFDVSTGVITSTTNGVGSIVSVGSGWYRIAVTATATSTASANFQIRLLNNVPALSYTGDGNSGVYIYGAQLSDSASLDPYVPTPGAAPSSTAFYGPRFDFDPVTLLPRGLLVEEQRTNLLLNSLITGANLSTQNVTVTAVAHTISFYGTGSITLSGAHSATVNGTGAYPTRTTLTFTPTAGTLTCTVSGTVQFANLEVGAFATSYIPTVASTVTRSADVATITGQNFAQWYRQPEGTLVAEFSGPSGGYSLNMTDGTNNNATGIVYVGATTLRGISVVSGVGRFVDMAASAAPAVNKTSYGYRLNDLGGSTNGGAVVANTTAPIPTLDRMFVGTFSNFSYLNGHIRNIRFIPARAADFQLQGLST